MAETLPETGLHHVEQVMGTVFSFDVRDRPTPALAGALREAVDRLHEIDAVFSPYRPESPISRLARAAAAEDAMPAQVLDVLARCEEAAARTRGAFTARAGGRLDPSGLVKGWAVEEAWRILHTAGARNLLVNGGGDLRLSGEPEPGTPWRVGIADPVRRDRLLTTVVGRDLAVATSGSAERGGHITDPRTGRPAAGLLSATVTGPSLTWADVYATAAVVLGAEAAEWITEHPGYALYAVHAAGGPGEWSGTPWIGATAVAVDHRKL